MHRTRILESAADLALFASRYERRAGHAVDVSYLSGATVRGLFDATGELVGGVVINTVGPLRYLAALPADVQATVLPHPDDTCESTCLWIERHVPRAARVWMYLAMLLDVRRCGRRWFLGGATNAPLARHYASAGMELLYAGQGVVGGHSFPVWLYASTIPMMLRGTLRQIMGYLRRPTRARLATTSTASST